MKFLMKNKMLPMCVTVLFVLLGSNPVLSAGDPVAGKEKSAACVACHGADGNSVTPTFPKIAGQYKDYLFTSLMSYKNGQRNNAIMSGIVAALSEQDMEDLAAFYASQEGLYTLGLEDAVK